MIAIGNLALFLALACSAWAVLAGVFGGVQRRRDFIASAENAAYAAWGMISVATIVMLHALITSDFSIKYVAGYSSTSLPFRYKLTALWGGMEGSLLFWALILTSFIALVQWQNRDRNRVLMPFVTATSSGVALFFIALLVFITPPFATLPFTPAEGTDLNPLLQNYWMQIHPPALYLGYVSWTIPFAFAIAALATGRLDDLWIRTSRRWCLTAWFFLSLGNLFGARWAYEVLGWGGYWAWDPVENAAFMPWLTGTAYLHSVMIQERKDMLKVWNLTLIIMTFALTIFGTFLTRSGVISSVHSFTQSGLGPFFLAFLAFAIALSIALLIYRLPELRPRHQLDSILSRESAFLFNNLLLVGIAFATLWGTLFPVLSEWVRGVKITVGPPFFNKVNAPLAIALLLLMGIGPLIAWRRASWTQMRSVFLLPVTSGVLAGMIAFFAGMHSLSALLVVTFSTFVLHTVLDEFRTGISARRRMVGGSIPSALSGLIRKNQRRYGGYVVHVGIVFIFLGVTMSSVYRVEEAFTVRQGESFTIDRYRLDFVGITNSEDDHVAKLAATLEVYEGDKHITTLAPEKRFYKKPEQPATEVAFRSTMRDDLYVILGSLDDAGNVTFQAYVNPLVMWMWIGGFVLCFGTFICVAPTGGSRKRERARDALAEQVRA
ncbi:MAG: cytochrome c-type biogenesis protein CcmF [Candidatus Binatia bacterium]|jgi:cytochrome c-type biogenesis protein CcmF